MSENINMICDRELQKQSERKDEIIGVDFPAGLPEIIQGYMSDETIYNGSPYVSSMSFFGNKELLLAHCIADQILWGHSDEAERLITMNTKVLLCKVERQNPQGGILKGTLYQFLLNIDDDYIKNRRNESLLEMVHRLLLNLPEGALIAEKQRDSWFQKWDEKSHISELQFEFDKVAHAFDESKSRTGVQLANDDNLQTALEKFETYLKGVNTNKDNEGSLIAKKNCIHKLWDYASRFYNSEKCRAYGNGNSPKNKLFRARVLGTIDLNLPAWAMQILHFGILQLAQFNERVNRVDVSSYYDSSLSDHSSSRLGVNSYMSLMGGHAREARDLGRGVQSGWVEWLIDEAWASGSLFQSYLERQKQQKSMSQNNCCIIL